MLTHLSTSFQYKQVLSVRPGGEVRYKQFPLVPSKSSGSVSRSIPSSPLPYLSSFFFLRSLLFLQGGGFSFLRDRVYSVPSLCLPLAGAAIAASALGNTSEFHPSDFSHSKMGLPGYGSLVLSSVPGDDGQVDLRKSLTSLAKNKIRWAAAAMEEYFGKDRCVFLTGTLPGSTDSAKKVFASYSSWFADRLQKWLRKYFSIDGNLYYCYVWELQSGRNALHLHALCATSEPQLLIEKFQSYWIHLLESISDFSGVDLFERLPDSSNLPSTWRNNYDFPVRRKLAESWSSVPVREIMAFSQVVLKSTSAYLSKYLSKSSFLPPDCPIPVRWWGKTRAVDSLIDKLSYHFELPVVDDEFVSHCDDFVKSSLESVADFVAESTYSFPSFNHYEDGSPSTFKGFISKHLGWIAWMDSSTALALASFISSAFNEELSHFVVGARELTADFFRSWGSRLSEFHMDSLFAAAAAARTEPKFYGSVSVGDFYGFENLELKKLRLSLNS